MVYIVPFNPRNDGDTSYNVTYYIVIGKTYDHYGNPAAVFPPDSEDYREGEDYVYLKASPSTFTWEMDNTEDITTAIRTFTGYIRIMDDGYDSEGDTFDWRSLIPSGSTDIPFVLWIYENDVQSQREETIIVTRGYLAPDNFTSGLVNYPVVREYPVCCCLNILSDQKFSPMSRDGRTVTFAEMLYQVLSTIGFTPDNIYFPGTKVAEWLGITVQMAHFFDYSHVDISEMIKSEPRISYAEALEEFCELFGLCVCQDGSDIVFTDIKCPYYSEYSRIDMDYLYNYPEGTTPTQYTRVTATSVPSNILTDSSRDIVQGWKTAEVSCDDDDRSEIMFINTNEITEDYMDSIDQFQQININGSPGAFGKIVGTAGYYLDSDTGRMWKSPDIAIFTRSHTYNVGQTSVTSYAKMILLSPLKYKDENDDTQNYANAYESINDGHLGFFIILYLPQNHTPSYHTVPLLRFETPLYHFIDGSFLQISFRLQYYKDAFGSTEGVPSDSYLWCRLKNTFTGKYYDDAARQWTTDANTFFGISTRQGRQKGTYGIYYAYIECSDAFAFLSGGSGAFQLDVFYWWNTKYTVGGIDRPTCVLSDFKMEVVHTLDQKRAKVSSEEETVSNASSSVKTKSIKLPFIQSKYCRNSPDSIVENIPWDVPSGETVTSFSAKKRQAQVLAAWGAHPREYLTIKTFDASVPDNLHNIYSITGDDDVVRQYRVLSKSTDLERNFRKVQLVEIS